MNVIPFCHEILVLLRIVSPTPGLPSECDSFLPCDTGSVKDSTAPTPGLPSDCDSILPCDTGSVTDVIAPTPGCDRVLPCDTHYDTDVEASQCGGGNADSDRYVMVFSENQNVIPYQKALEILRSCVSGEIPDDQITLSRTISQVGGQTYLIDTQNLTNKLGRRCDNCQWNHDDTKKYPKNNPAILKKKVNTSVADEQSKSISDEVSIKEEKETHDQSGKNASRVSNANETLPAESTKCKRLSLKLPKRNKSGIHFRNLVSVR